MRSGVVGGIVGGRTGFRGSWSSCGPSRSEGDNGFSVSKGVSLFCVLRSSLTSKGEYLCGYDGIAELIKPGVEAGFLSIREPSSLHSFNMFSNCWIICVVAKELLGGEFVSPDSSGLVRRVASPNSRVEMTRSVFAEVRNCICKSLRLSMIWFKAVDAGCGVSWLLSFNQRLPTYIEPLRHLSISEIHS
jgi:hypothetical protein